MGGENQNACKSNKRKKRHAKYLQHGGKKSTISSGVQGFLITCVGGKERQAIKEAINLLDQFYEKPELRISSETVVGSVELAQPSSTSTSAAAGEKEDSETPSESKAEASVRPPPEAEQAVAEGEGKVQGEGEEDDEEDESSDDEESGDDAGERLGWVKSRRLDESGKAQGTAEAVDSQKRGKDESNGAAATTKPKEASKNFDELLADEISELRDKKKARFVGYETGCNGVIFVRMHHQKGAIQVKGPKELAEAIVRDAAASKQSKTR